MLFDLLIEKMVQGGDGMARLPDGRVCFVQGALPGELCQVNLTQNRKDFTRGRALKILKKSEDRVAPKCPLYGKCGGCSLQHLNVERETFYLEQVERENFRRLAHAELPDNFKIHTGPAWGYRNRARVVLRGGKNQKVVYGFRKQESNEVAAFESCPVLTTALNEFLKNNAQRIYESARRRELDLNLFDNGQGQISYFYRGMPAAEFQKNALSVVEIGGVKIHSDASVFFQSNLSLLPRLVESVRTAVDMGLECGEASDAWLIDLFSGVGFFAAILQNRFKKITTVERDGGCLKHANENLGVKTRDAAGEKCIVENVSSAAEEWLVKNVVDVPATLIVDPPRTGLPKEALDAIIASSVNRLIYVSCDPVTLARDYAKFSKAGFVLKQAEGFAFYPRTPHLEMLFVLSR